MMNIFLFGLLTLALLGDTANSQHLITCPVNECWCCPFSGGKCYNEGAASCCETPDSYPCSDVDQCCETDTTCCDYGGCCPDGTWCCEVGLCCYDQPYIFQATCVPSDRWLKPLKTRSLLQHNLTGDTCGKLNCFCCCEGLVCPVEASGSTESCIEKSEDIDMYCQDMGACPEDVGGFSKKLQEESTLKKNASKMPGLGAIIMTYISQIRNQFYHAGPGGSKRFQFAVFKFGPADSYWDPLFNGIQVDWTAQLVVVEPPNNWQASRYSSCQDGCHTEAAIIGDQTATGLEHMFHGECAEVDRPLVLNVYSFYSYCSIRAAGCQELVQDTISTFFNDELKNPCNTYRWVINIVWTMQYRDQSGADCIVAWRDWGANMEEDHPNVTVNFGVQKVEKIIP